MGCQLWPAGPPNGLVSGGLDSKEDWRWWLSFQVAKTFNKKSFKQSFTPCLFGTQLNSSTLPGPSRPLGFVWLILSLLLPAFLVVSLNKTEDLRVTYTAPIFLWKLLLTMSTEALWRLVLAMWIRLSSTQPTILSLKNSIVTAAQPRESSDLALEPVFVVPTSGYLRKVLPKSGSVKHLLLRHFSMSTSQKSFLFSEVCGIWRAEIKIKPNCHLPAVSQPRKEVMNIETIGHWHQLLTPHPQRPLFCALVSLRKLEKERPSHCHCVHFVCLLVNSCSWMCFHAKFTVATKEKSLIRF